MVSSTVQQLFISPWANSGHPPPTGHLSPQPVRCRLRSAEARALETAVAEEAVKELRRIQNTSSFWWLLGLTVFLRSLTESISRFTSIIFEFPNFWIYRMSFILKNLKQRHFTNHALVCSAAVTMATVLLNPFFFFCWLGNFFFHDSFFGLRFPMLEL